MNRTVVALACALLACPGVHAQQPVAGKQDSAESLQVPAYPAVSPWKEITHAGNAEQQLVEWIPSDQGVDDIHDILTRQVFFKLKGMRPAAFLGPFLQRVAGACERVRTNGPKEGTELGYPVAYAQAYCANEKGAAKDVDILVKAIAGHDALYVVQREFRRPAQPGATPGVTTFSPDSTGQMKARMEAMTTANRFLVDKVRLCPPSMDAGHCTAANAATPSVPTSAASSRFTEGKSTATEIKAALGTPRHEDHNPDGRFVYLYDTSNGDVMSYLFDSKGVLIRMRGYAMQR